VIATDLNRLPIFQSLRPDELAKIADTAEVQTAEAGDTIVAQWDHSEDFYVVLAGTLDVLLEKRRVRGLGPGEFFGELAAIDWGGGFRYPRLATVVASSPVRLLRVPAEVLNDLVRSNADLQWAIQHAARERMRAGTS
jgi:CRP-like cAMP-binding protein